VSVVGVASRALAALFRRRTWAELAYLLLSVLLAAVGFGYVVACFVLTVGLSVTALGIPVLAVVVPATRLLARLRLGLARVLLGEVVAAPPPFRPAGGVFARLRSGLRDGPGWRAVAFQVVSLPLAIAGLVVAAFSWAWGLVALTAPVQRALDVNQVTISTGGGTVRRGVFVLGVAVDTWPAVALLSACGAVLLLVAPWAVRAVLVLDRLLVRALLGQDDRTARIAALQRSRTAAVEDAAAGLRRIERDLHDGVQARLVALTMNLTMLGETLGRDEQASRSMLAAARDNARDAIRELREVIQGVHPPILDKGLDAAIATLASRSPVPVGCEVQIDRRPPAAIETIAYFCVAELLSNVVKHSGASEARIVVSQRRGGLRLVVSDNGRGGAGGPGGTGPGGTGLRGLAERIGTVDGTLDIVSPPGGPTVITVDLPPQP
jgi:signal transduction histidine kinase